MYNKNLEVYQERSSKITLHKTEDFYMLPCLSPDTNLNDTERITEILECSKAFHKVILFYKLQ